jgi:hypothetical protein
VQMVHEPVAEPAWEAGDQCEIRRAHESGDLYICGR